MADTRRQSQAGKVATPKVGASNAGPAPQGPGLVDLDVALNKCIGARVKFTLLGPTGSGTTTLEGTLFTADPVLNLIAVDTAVPPPSPVSQSNLPGDYHIFPISRVQSFQLLSLAAAKAGDGGLDANLSIQRVDLQALRNREEAAVAEAKRKEALKGKGVTKEAQDIFDALTRTLPTRWHGQSIIVSDSVIIAPPYTAESCTAPKDKQPALQQVKRVLEGERKKIAQRNAGVRTPVEGAPRKGG